MDVFLITIIIEISQVAMSYVLEVLLFYINLAALQFEKHN